MVHYLLFALLFTSFVSEPLGINTSIAPGLSVKNAFLYLVALMLAIETAVFRQRKLELLSVFVPFVVYVLYAMFTWIVILLLIEYPGYGLLGTLIGLKGGPVEHLMVLLVFFYGISDSRRALWMLRKFVWLVIVGNVITVIDALNIPDLGIIWEGDDGRVGGLVGNSNEYAAFLVFFLPAIFVVYSESKGFKKLLAGIGAALSCLAFLMALSRGAIVGAVVGGILSAFFLRAHIPAQTIVRVGLWSIILFVLVVAVGFAAGYGDLMLQRFDVSGSSNKFDATSGRTMIWGRALASMLDYPVTFVTGFGWYAYETSRNFHFATHNYYLNILYDLGMIGVVLFMSMAANILRVARAALGPAGQEGRGLLVAFVVGFLALLVSIFFGNFYQTWIYIWAVVGISLRLAVSETGAERAIAR